MTAKRQHIARLQSDFYRDSYHKLLRFVIFEILIMLVLIAAIVYFVFFQPLPQYYATTTGGMIMPLPAR